jgi:hypothetical protein
MGCTSSPVQVGHSLRVNLFILGARITVLRGVARGLVHEKGDEMEDGSNIKRLWRPLPLSKGLVRTALAHALVRSAPAVGFTAAPDNQRERRTESDSERLASMPDGVL